MMRMTETVKVLLITNVIFFLGAQFLLPDHGSMFALYFPENGNFRFWQVVTHMFMHDQNSIFHILFNMYALWAFGSPVENILGQKRFIFFYFSAGLGAALIHTAVLYFNYYGGYNALLDQGITAPQIQSALQEITRTGSANFPNGIDGNAAQRMIDSYFTAAVGASGAIYGILVAFGMMFPNMELMLIFLPIPIKAKYFIPALILLDLFSGVTGFSLFGQNIANFAHIGGALFGFIMIWYWKKNSFNDKRWN
ncbi:MAG: rhomboid family intramembrane serine protease [Cytophagaceae bacterium]|nr:rhomboid family intramembrane serine protease [Cytophagaceae bacterium]|tara:strand:- start:467 stop:1222 length:756 start_codon:yes stop_codon:yes gene_type:complete